MSIHDVSRTLRRGRSLADAAGVLILLHGRGADAEDIAGLAGYLPAEDLAVLAPQATDFSWYPQRFFVPLAENEPWLSSALALVDQLVKEARAAGIPDERIAIAGFSQGGCLALEYAHRNPKRYGLVAGLSSSLIGPPGVARQPADLQQTPVLLACADHDPHIPLPLVEESAVVLAGSNADFTKQIFRGYDHTVFPEEIAWLGERISGWKKGA